MIVVRDTDVEHVANFIEELYSHPNCSLDIHAAYCREESELTEAEYGALNQRFLGEDDDNMTIIKSFLREPYQNGTQICEALGVQRRTAIDKIAPFRDAKLIGSRRGSTGYRATPKFNRWVKRLVREGELH